MTKPIPELGTSILLHLEGVLSDHLVSILAEPLPEHLLRNLLHLARAEGNTVFMLLVKR